MTKKTLKKAASLFTAIKHLNSEDCSNFIRHLDDKGVEIICRIIHYVLNGELVLSPKTRKSLRNKIKIHLNDLQKVVHYPKNSRHINKKRQILQKGGGISSVLSVIASAVIPIITHLLTKKK